MIDWGCVEKVQEIAKKWKLQGGVVGALKSLGEEVDKAMIEMEDRIYRLRECILAHKDHTLSLKTCIFELQRKIHGLERQKRKMSKDSQDQNDRLTAVLEKAIEQEERRLGESTRYLLQEISDHVLMRRMKQKEPVCREINFFNRQSADMHHSPSQNDLLHSSHSIKLPRQPIMLNQPSPSICGGKERDTIDDFVHVNSKDLPPRLAELFKAPSQNDETLPINQNRYCFFKDQKDKNVVEKMKKLFERRRTEICKQPSSSRQSPSKEKEADLPNAIISSTENSPSKDWTFTPENNPSAAAEDHPLPSQRLDRVKRSQGINTLAPALEILEETHGGLRPRLKHLAKSVENVRDKAKTKSAM